jgi:dTDP-4-dehydrorhamnose 3,5-epimerase-like enzyme/dTDP-4-dehydrorhamnose reductase
MNSKSFSDNRGKLIFPFKDNKCLGEIMQCTVSKNKKNVFRGFHKNNFDKLVTCIQGRILDIILNLDENAEDYLKPKYYNLDSNTKQNQILVPRNYAHGFLALNDNTIVLYHFNGKFSNDETTHIHYLDPLININLPINNPIISEKDNIKNFIKPVDYIIIGRTGYLGNHIFSILKKQNKNVIAITTRLQEIERIKEQLLLYKPKYVINAAGLTGSPNIDWCDDNKEKTIETNITYQLTLCHICKELNIHLTIFGSGGIFKNNKIYTENDRGDYFDKFYSEARIYLENICKNYNNILYLRINYPISSCNNKKNLLIKLSKYTSIANSNLSITCVDSLFPLLSEIIENKEIGIFNFVNPGVANLVQIKKMYNKSKKITDKFNIIEDNDKSCPILDTTRIEKYNVVDIQNATKKIIL